VVTAYKIFRYDKKLNFVIIAQILKQVILALTYLFVQQLRNSAAKITSEYGFSKDRCLTTTFSRYIINVSGITLALIALCRAQFEPFSSQGVINS
jgi:uncharacterized membrane protein YqhA